MVEEELIHFPFRVLILLYLRTWKSYAFMNKYATESWVTCPPDGARYGFVPLPLAQSQSRFPSTFELFLRGLL